MHFSAFIIVERKNFSQEQIDEIIRSYREEKLSQEDIGRKYNCSEIVIRRILKENNITRRKGGPVSVVDTDELIRLYKEGHDSVELGRMFGLVPSAVSQRIPRDVIRPRGPDPKLSDADLIQFHSIEGISIADLSRRFYDVPFSNALRDRAIKLGIYSQNDDWIENRKNPIHIHDGYAKVKFPNHPRADDKGYVPMHIIVMEQQLGRYLNYSNQQGEVVHHIDCNKIHNAPSNLIVCQSNSMHRNLHKNLDKCLSKLIKKGIIDFDETQRCYYLNFNNPTSKPSYVPPDNATRTGDYFQVVFPGHHRVKDDRDRVLLHIIIAEQKYGRNISVDEPIHHIDLDKLNDSPRNLFLCTNQNEHNQLIRRQLISLVPKLFDKGILVFNRATNEYKITCCKNQS